MPDLDLKISIFLLLVSFAIGLITWGISRKWFLALVVFSILGNTFSFGNVDSRMYGIYHIIWIKWFTIFIWPLINIFLIIKYIKDKKKK